MLSTTTGPDPARNSTRWTGSLGLAVTVTVVFTGKFSAGAVKEIARGLLFTTTRIEGPLGPLFPATSTAWAVIRCSPSRVAAVFQPVASPLAAEASAIQYPSRKKRRRATPEPTSFALPATATTPLTTAPFAGEVTVAAPGACPSTWKLATRSPRLPARSCAYASTVCVPSVSSPGGM